MDGFGLFGETLRSVPRPKSARVRPEQSRYNADYYSAHKSELRARNSAYSIKHRDVLRFGRYGLTETQFKEMLAAQRGLCAICLSALGTAQIDHDHGCCPGRRSCGKCVRGLICASCNHMLGKAADSPQTLEAGAAYLRRHKALGAS